MHKRHGDDVKQTAQEQGNEFLPGTAKYIGKDVIPIQGQPEEEEEKKHLHEQTIKLGAMLEEEAEARGSDYESEESEEDPKEKWDAETILTTYTNTDNHPGVIKTQSKVKVNKKAKI